jgi:leucyl aminopeptidase
MDNGPARNASHAQQLQTAGEELGDMFEISTIRKEDIAFHRGESVQTCYSFQL